MKTAVMVMAVALCGLFTQLASANGHGCCTDCNTCCDDDNKVCKLICTTKKIKKIVYGCKCKTICIPCPSCKGCTHCEEICINGGKKCCDPCKCGKDPKACIKWHEYIPNGAKTKKIKILTKFIVIKEIPSYKWIVVDGGKCGCGSGTGHGAPKTGKPTEAPMPPMPPKAAFKRPPMGAKIGDELPVKSDELDALSKIFPNFNKVVTYQEELKKK